MEGVGGWKRYVAFLDQPEGNGSSLFGSQDGRKQPRGFSSKDGSASNATGSVGYGLVHRWDVVVQGCIHGNTVNFQLVET